jgi:hypothetical protein
METNTGALSSLNTNEPVVTAQTKAVAPKNKYALPAPTGTVGLDPSILESMQQIINQKEAKRTSFMEGLKDVMAYDVGFRGDINKSVRERAAEKEGNVGMHHRHMTKFHERMSEWHSDRGRHGSAEKHETLADDHHEKAVKLGEATDARIRLQRAFEREKERRERSERLGRELLNPTKKPTPATPTQGVKEAVDNAVDEGIARLISKSIKRVTATKPTPQEKADIRLNK